MLGDSHQNSVYELAEYLGDVAFDPRLWDGFLQLLSRYTDDSKIILQVIEGKPFNCMNLQSYGFMEETIQKYIDHYINVSPWKGVILQAAEAAPIWTDQHVSMKEYFKSEFYNELMRAEGGADSATGMNIVKENDRMAILGVHFDGKKSENLHWSAAYFLSSLQKDIKRVINIHGLLDAEALNSAQAGGFSVANIKLPAFIIDSSSHVISINNALLEMIEKYDFIEIGALNKLRFTDEDVQNSFQLKINNLLKNMLYGSDDDHADLRVYCSNLIFRFSFFPMNHKYNIRDFSGVITRNAAVNTFLVVVSEQKDKDIYSDLSELLHKNYGLTKTEIKLVSYLADGNSLLAISQASNTSIHTVRTHLKSIFQKMNTRRQQDLIALVHMLRRQVDG